MERLKRFVLCGAGTGSRRRSGRPTRDSRPRHNTPSSDGLESEAESIDTSGHQEPDLSYRRYPKQPPEPVPLLAPIPIVVKPVASRTSYTPPASLSTIASEEDTPIETEEQNQPNPQRSRRRRHRRRRRRRRGTPRPPQSTQVSTLPGRPSNKQEKPTVPQTFSLTGLRNDLEEFFHTLSYLLSLHQFHKHDSDGAKLRDRFAEETIRFNTTLAELLQGVRKAEAAEQLRKSLNQATLRRRRTTS